MWTAVAGLGEEVATNVGVDSNRIILLGTVLIAVTTGVVTVVVGNLPFLGLIVPNIVWIVAATICAAIFRGCACSA